MLTMWYCCSAEPSSVIFIKLCQCLIFPFVYHVVHDKSYSLKLISSLVLECFVYVPPTDVLCFTYFGIWLLIPTCSSPSFTHFFFNILFSLSSDKKCYILIPFCCASLLSIFPYSFCNILGTTGHWVRDSSKHYNIQTFCQV